MGGLDAAKLPAGLLMAAALLQFAPQFVTPLALAVYALAAWCATALKLKGLAAAAAMVVVVVGVQALGVVDLGVGPVRDLADRAPDLGGIGSAVGG